jgi:hypothetical protein
LAAGLLYVLVDNFDVSKMLAPLLVIAVLLPITYLMNKKVLGSDKRDA